MLQIEVIYATPERTARYVVELPEGATVRSAIERSGVLVAHPEIDLVRGGAGIFGRRVTLDQALRAGDRVEILRPLGADPRAVRRRRAEKFRR
jgi:putative ubiquitin-RnfH superfamily antitoxin RatB of RatAB toxin-antitoxin module